MEWDKFTPIDFENFVPTELHIPGIRQYIYDILGKRIELQGFKFKKSNFSFRRKNGKSYEEIVFLFYNYHPLNYSFDFFITIFNERIENIKLLLPPQKHYEKFNKYSLFITEKDFSHHIKTLSSSELGYDYIVVTLDDLIEVGKALSKTFEEEVLPLTDRLTTVSGIDLFFDKKTSKWSVGTGFMNNVCTELIVAKLNGKRDYQKVYKDLCNNIKSSDNPNYQTLTVVENLYDYLFTF